MDYLPCLFEPPGGAVLSGTVFDGESGAAINGTQVSVPGRAPVHTTAAGGFSFDGLPLGDTTLIVTMAGYQPVSRPVKLSEGSATSISIGMTPISADFGVAEVRGRYCGPDLPCTYYLDAVNLSETLTATVDWHGHTPGAIRWVTPHGTYEGPCPGTAASRTFDMGADFGAGGTLTVIAVSGDNPPMESAAVIANFKVIPPPPLGVLAPLVAYTPKTVGSALLYEIAGVNEVAFSICKWDSGRVPGDFPLFGGQEMGVGPVFSLSGTVSHDGTAELFTVGRDVATNRVIRKGVPTKGHKGIKLPFVELGGHGSVAFGMAWSDGAGDWLWTGGFELGADVTWGSPAIPVAVVIVPIYVRAECSLDLVLNLGVGGWTSTGPEWSGSFEFEPLLKGVLGAGVSGVACVEGYLGGGFHGGVQFLPEWDWMDPYIILVGGVQVVAGPWTIGPLELRYTWPEQLRGPQPTWDEMLRATHWTLLPRDYLKPGSRQEPCDSGDVPILVGVFPYSTPDVCRVGEDMLAVWIADDTGRSLINRTELTFGRFHSGAWSPATPIADDGTADINPRLVSLPDGNAVCVWQDADAVLPDETPFEEFLSHLEIAVATYDPVAGDWSAPIHLTSDSSLDRSPSIAAGDGGHMLAVWVTNAANDLWGSATAPNTIRWSAYDGVTWSPPGEIVAGLGTVLDTALGFDGTTGTFVYVVDADDDLDTTTDQELWATTYSGGVWSPPVRLTNDGVCDAAPHLAYDAGDVLRLAWLKGNEIRFATGLDVGNAVTVVTPGESLGAKDFDLVVSDSGRIALVWSDVSQTYEPVLFTALLLRCRARAYAA